MKRTKPTPKRDEWDAIRYPSLTDEENDLIRRARRAGFAAFYPAFPTGEDQDRNTLAGATTFLSFSPSAGRREGGGS